MSKFGEAKRVTGLDALASKQFGSSGKLKAQGWWHLAENESDIKIALLQKCSNICMAFSNFNEANLFYE